MYIYTLKTIFIIMAIKVLLLLLDMFYKQKRKI